MTLRPSLLPLRLLLLLLLRGAVCRAEAGSETESPVRTLQVETLVRRRESREGAVDGGRARLRGRSGSKGSWERGGGSAGTELGGAGWRGRNLPDLYSAIIGGAPRAVC